MKYRKLIVKKNSLIKNSQKGYINFQNNNKKNKKNFQKLFNILL